MVARSTRSTAPVGGSSAIGGGTPDPDAATWFASIGGAVVVVEPDATYERWFAEHGVVWALQRPDFHLYGTAGTTDGATALLDELRHHLAMTEGATAT